MKLHPLFAGFGGVDPYFVGNALGFAIHVESVLGALPAVIDPQQRARTEEGGDLYGYGLVGSWEAPGVHCLMFAKPLTVLARVWWNEGVKVVHTKQDVLRYEELLQEVFKNGGGKDRGLTDCPKLSSTPVCELQQLKAENAALHATAARSAMRIKELDLLFGRYLLAMRSAVIEMEHGKGAESAMDWIINSLAGPGEFAPADATDAQAYFDREVVAIDAGMSEVMRFLDRPRLGAIQ